MVVVTTSRCPALRRGRTLRAGVVRTVLDDERDAIVRRAPRISGRATRGTPLALQLPAVVVLEAGDVLVIPPDGGDEALVADVLRDTRIRADVLQVPCGVIGIARCRPLLPLAAMIRPAPS